MLILVDSAIGKILEKTTIIRPAEASDFDDIADILHPEIVHGHAHFGTEPPSAEDLRTEWENGRDVYPFLVAQAAEDVTGFARAYPWKARGAYRWSCEVGIYVRPEFQGRGIATALYEVLFPELESRGFHTIIAGIALPNDASIKLHERFGMKHVGTLPAVGQKFGRWIDVGYWVRVLGVGE